MTDRIEIPEFPENDIGLKRGSVLIALTGRTVYLGIKEGEGIPIGFDGKYIRCINLTWSLEGLKKEIEAGIWDISNEGVDLSDEDISQHFAKHVECISSSEN
ncbi:MAG: hypothetical protein KAI57_01645 [Candidatus Pacebacteria bacterium]|nr:hypothetical protein [Candidatus Paceibacterota bacterium]